MLDLIHYCSNTDVNEAAPPPPQVEEKKIHLPIRRQVVAMWDTAELARELHMSRMPVKPGSIHSLKDIHALIRYGCEFGHTGRKKRFPVDVPKMIKDWTDWIAVFSTTHNKKELDKVEYDIDNLLNPLLTAPVKQLREFYSGLVDSLENDARIPFYVWQTFKVYREAVIDPSEDKEAVLRLKKKLASEVADLVEKEDTIKVSLHKALVGALQWRSPEALKEIKQDLKAGAKPKIEGRQSCLFLTTKQRGKSSHTVML